MRLLRDYLIAQVKSRVPEFKTVRMFNNQFVNSNNDDKELNTEQAFDYPACFIELIEEEVRPVSLGIRYVDLTINFHLGKEAYSKERPQDYDFIDRVDAALSGMRGAEGDTVQFSSLVEAVTDIDEDFSNVNNPILTYETTWTKKNSYTRRGFTQKPAPTAHDVTGTILTS